MVGYLMNWHNLDGLVDQVPNPTCYLTWWDFLGRFATSWNNLESTRGGRWVISKRRSVGRTLAAVGESCSSCFAAADDDKTRKRNISTIELNSNTDKPATTKLNTSKPTATKYATAKTTANKTAFTLLLTDLEFRCQTGSKLPNWNLPNRKLPKPKDSLKLHRQKI